MIRATHLVILHGEITPLLPLLVRDLHKEPTRQRLSDIVPVVLILPRRTTQLEVEPLHAAFQLCPDVVRLSERSCVEVVLPAPILRFALVRFVCMVDVEEGEVVAVRVGKLGFGDIRFFLRGSGAREHVGD
jgi:hypothetical protein